MAPRLRSAAWAVLVLFCVALPVTAALAPARAQEPGFAQGMLLVAAPEMPDPRFAETVIYMVSHDATGAFGLVLNRPLGTGPIGDLLLNFEIEDDTVVGDIAVHYGGPVEVDLGFVLHSADYLRKDTIVVDKTFAMTSDPQVLRDIGTGKGPKQAFFAMGYSGWGPGQLEREMATRSWFTVPAEEGLVFDADTRTKWERASAKRGHDL